MQSTDQEIETLRAAARRFLSGTWPAERAVPSSSNQEELARSWQGIVRQGWLQLIEEAAPGGMRIASMLLEELGRAGCPAPLLDAVIAQLVLSRMADGDEQITGLREQLRNGKALFSCVLGPFDGDQRAGVFQVEQNDETRLYGHAAFVEGAGLATHFLVLTGWPKQVAIVAAGVPGVAISETPGLCLPPLAEVEFNGATAITGLCNLDDGRAVRALARLGLMARSLGAATRGFELVTDYAKMRVQFGKKIGQYQAIQHKLANCLMSVETSRLALVRAANAYDHGEPDWIYAAGIAFAIANPALRQVCLETHHAFGGVSFWDEHEMPRHFRRIHADLVRCGGVHGAREDVAHYLLGEPR